MKSLEQLSSKELGRLFPIIIKEFNPDWKSWFETEKDFLLNIIPCKLIKQIEHFGSTAVDGLKAKPTIDIMIELNKDFSKKELIDIMIYNKYNYMGDSQDHLMFVKGYSTNGFDDKVFHIHLWEENHSEIIRRLTFRDNLRKNKNIAKKYETLKLLLGRKYEFDRESYTNGKKKFINEYSK